MVCWRAAARGEMAGSRGSERPSRSVEVSGVQRQSTDNQRISGRSATDR